MQGKLNMIKKTRVPLIKATEDYTKAMFNLSALVSEVRSEQGRKVLIDVLPFDISFISYLCKLSTIKIPIDYTIPPQIYYELTNQPKNVQLKMIKEVKSTLMKPSKLRKRLRIVNTTITSKEKPSKVNKLAKTLITLQNELKNMPAELRERAVNHIKTLL